LVVLIANDQDGLDDLPEIVESLGHTAIPWRSAAQAGPPSQRVDFDVALVALGRERARALSLIEQLADTAGCPVIAVQAAPGQADAREAARCGAFAHSSAADPEALQCAIEISMRRFADFHSLRGAFQRRAAIEQAKGILMARHALDAASAFALLRNHSQKSGRKLADIAALIVESHLLLPQSDSVAHTTAG
jgi:AmiR/NasT family two-component response regulator